MIKVIVHGYHGKMGSLICDMAGKDDDFGIVAGIDAFSSNYSEPFPTFEKIEDCDMPADVIIDFSIAKAVDDLIKYAVSQKIALVICTTGLLEETINNIKEASKIIPIFKSANMSLGVNLIASLLKKISPILYDEAFDIEIIEKHHNQKIDAPSGTAFLLADKIKESIGDLDYTFDRSSTREKRKKNEIGIHSVRGGTIVGEHEVIFAGADEVIEIKHKAYSKTLFAVGTIKATKFIYNKKPGLYDMQDLMVEYLN